MAVPDALALNELDAPNETNDGAHEHDGQDILLEDSGDANAVAFQLDYLTFVAADRNHDVGSRFTFLVTLIFGD